MFTVVAAAINAFLSTCPRWQSMAAAGCRAEYPAVKRALLWAITELGTITCDTVEVIRGAVALQTLSNGAVPLYGCRGPHGHWLAGGGAVTLRVQ